MLPNSVSPSTATEASAPPQLRLAARAESHAERETTTISSVIDEVVHRSHGQWRTSLDAVKETLATLERNCESAIETQKAGVTALIETLVASAAADAAAVAQQVQARTQAQIDELQRALATVQTMAESLQTDLAVERGRVGSISAQLELEVTARVRAEAERDDARRLCEQQGAAAESQLAALRSESDALKAELARTLQQLDAAVTERSKLIATFQMVQRALAVSNPETVVMPVDDARADARQVEQPQPLAGASNAAAEAEALVPAPVVDARITLAEQNPEAVADVTQMLEQIEAMYHLDLESGRPAIEVVDSLTSSLRYARDVVATRWNRDDCDASTLFDYQVDGLLQTHAGALFGRHLSIAAYASRQPAASPAQGDAGTR